MLLLVVILCVVLLVGGLPPVSGQWHHWGWGPSGIGAILLIVLVVLLLSGRL